MNWRLRFFTLLLSPSLPPAQFEDHENQIFSFKRKHHYHTGCIPPLPQCSLTWTRKTLRQPRRRAHSTRTEACRLPFACRRPKPDLHLTRWLATPLRPRRLSRVRWARSCCLRFRRPRSRRRYHHVDPLEVHACVGRHCRQRDNNKDRRGYFGDERTCSDAGASSLNMKCHTTS